MGKVRVLRGQVNAFQYQGAYELIQDDQRFNHGFRVKKFLISYEAPFDSASSSRDCYGVLATHADAIPAPLVSTSIIWNWADRRQVAWASTNHIGDSYVEMLPDLVDPTHVVVRNLFLGITAAVATGSTVFNYYIELEQIDLSDNEAVMAIVQEESQDVN